MVYNPGELISIEGFFASKEALPGVYVYLIKYKYLDGSVEKEEVLSGDVTVVR